MGYSNNKWRKILTILMIINLCFILFAKITKSFGAIDSNDSVINVEGGTITIPSFLIRNNNSNEYFLFQDPTLDEGVYNWSLMFTRGNSNLIKYDNYTTDNYEGPALKSSGSSPYGGLCLGWAGNYYYSLFTGTIQEYQSYLNNWNNVSPLSSGWVSYFAINNPSINTNSLDYDNCYIYCTADILDENNETLIPAGSYTPPSLIPTPYFGNVTEIENGNPDGVIIETRDYSKNDYLYFHLLEIQTGVSSADNSIYYYTDKTFALNKDSEYYSTMLADPNIYYYYIPRYKLGLSQNSSYLYVLNNSKNQIQNSHGLVSIDIPNGIYDVVQSDTAGVITSTEEQSDRMKNIEETLANNENTINNINNTINDTNVSEETNTDINTNLDFNNQNTNLNNLNNGFFSRLTTMLSNLLGYDLSQDTSVSLPLPNSNNSLVLHSNIIYNNVTGTLRTIINAFWIYIFTFYLWKFINKIYIAVSTGNILDSMSSSGEAITNNML